MKLNYQNLSSILKNYKTSQNSFISKEFLVPLEQENQINYKNIVQKDDIVKEGQVIAVSTNSSKSRKFSEDLTFIHSPVPGKVLDIIPVYTSSGKQKFAVKIKFGGEFSYLGKKNTEKSIEDLSSSQIINELIEKGVINTYNLRKIENPGLQIKNNSYKNLVIRLFDEDSFRYTDSLVAKIYTNEIVKGAQILAKAMNCYGILFVIDQKFENKEKLENFNISNLRILQVKTKKSPCGTQKQIEQAFRKSGIKKTSNLDITKNDFFTDSSTLYEVYKAVICSTPSVSHLVHFSGNCLYSSCLLDVKIGTTLKDIVNQIGGFAKEPSVIVINGLIYGNSVESLNVPITKSVKSVEFISKTKITDNQIYSCVNCGNCRYICPSKISPDVLYSYAVNFKEIPEVLKNTVLSCEECGICNTVCPARLPLTKTISYLKDTVCEEKSNK
ncbi:MAG: hypothetical protein MR739_06480 [Spirochaetia bacterium]|nr:hypothetical protein [Spirochaetia bacterium]MDD7611556.1 hypothetical protein [Spirochaetales bacterium]MDY5916132.1 hypothetical protein [Treponema sp.]